MKFRIVVILIAFALAGYIIHNTHSVDPVPIKKPLAQFPKTIGAWHVVKEIQSSDSVVRMLGVTDYINYEYANASGMIIDFYVGYYHAVGVDGTYHSPKNCLPGGGWGIALDREIKMETSGGSTVKIAELIIQNGPARQVVFYWYQNRGRIIASEYWEKVYLVLDALLMHRRDGAFVRIMIPCGTDKIAVAEAELEKFAGRALETLKQFLPGRKL